MVHISDGILSLPVLTAGWVITFTVLSWTVWKKKKEGEIAEEMPKLSVVTAAFFVASLIHVPIGPTSVHLILSGLVGVVLGYLAYPAIFVGLILQAFLFQHGGITTIGINAVNMGIPALVAYGVFKFGSGSHFLSTTKSSALGALAGGLAVTLSVFFCILSLLSTSFKYMGVAKLLAAGHIPVIAIEAAVVGSATAFLEKVKPEMLSAELGGEKK
ncbi:cobalamin biosynthesis protein CbiM [candidate division MSBL1 archaeon SCGC-AAA259E17]|uniref:Cobalamin biosynthesis protein CbiM n=1 Tax=candidate division MSBL1 archaeon SCGC-AAA259E17 TaxID=1698263 RepID=A0A133UH12_9EURY|nr:cobalamin biosynthesis protein CbiM [candidate division MSBL1 archaeon SCGC-AAA259E17]